MIRIIAAYTLLLHLTMCGLAIAEKPLKVFILAGQSNMVGWGNSKELPEALRIGSDRVLMFENGKWQPLKPFRRATKNQEKFGLTEFSFGPEIAFAHEMAKAWPDETIGIVKLAVGGTSILTWKPNWSKEDADRVGQGRLGSLYKQLLAKVEQAGKAHDIEIVGFLWLQGGGDMKNVAIAKEYLDNLISLVAAVRKDTGAPNLPFLCGSLRRTDDPDDLSDFVPERVDGPYPAIQWVVKAQWDAQKQIANARTVILRDIKTHPKNVHYDTAGQLEVGRLFAKEFLALTRQPTGNSQRVAPTRHYACFQSSGRERFSLLLIAVVAPPFLFYLNRRGWRLSIRASLGLLVLLGLGLTCLRGEYGRIFCGEVIVDWPQLMVLLGIGFLLSTFFMFVVYVFRGI